MKKMHTASQKITVILVACLLAAGCSRLLGTLAPDADKLARRYIGALSAHDWKQAAQIAGLTGTAAEAGAVLRPQAAVLDEGQVKSLTLTHVNKSVKVMNASRTSVVTLVYDVETTSGRRAVLVTITEGGGKKQVSLERAANGDAAPRATPRSKSDEPQIEI